jgi:hypothetical protein
LKTAKPKTAKAKIGTAKKAVASRVKPKASDPKAGDAKRRNWLGLASADHIRRGRANGFMQLGHGKRAPLMRVKPGDCIVYYSPVTTYGSKDKLQSFTAIGVVKAGEPYEATMGEGFRAFRRDVAWKKARETPIAGLLDKLELTKGKVNWGYQLRFGLIELTAHDINAIARAMGVKKI